MTDAALIASLRSRLQGMKTPARMCLYGGGTKAAEAGARTLLAQIDAALAEVERAQGTAAVPASAAQEQASSGVGR